MAEGCGMTDEQRETIILEAIRCCGIDATDYEVAAHAAAVKNRLRWCMDERSVVSKVLEAPIIRATLLDCRLEESSQRYVVTFRVKNGSDVETIRTERRDAQPWVDTMIASLTLGEEMLVYKTIESVGEGVSTHKVRVAPLLMPLQHQG